MIAAQKYVKFAPWLVSLVILLLVASLLMRLENPVSLDDGLRHYAMGKLIAERGIGAADWGNFFYAGYFAHHAVDPWLLSDVLFAPLANLQPVTALRIFTLGSIACLLFSFFYAFRVLRTAPQTAAVLLVILVLFESVFFYRLLVARPYGLITPLAIVILAAALERRHWLVALALVTAVLLSHLFVFPLFIAGACVLWRLFLGEKRTAINLAAYAGIGVIVGFLLHPAPLEYLLYMRDVFLKIPFLPGLDIGTEMHYGARLGIRTFVMIGIAILLGTELKRSALTPSEIRASILPLLGVLVLVFGIMFLKWTRAIDFLWPLLILLVAAQLSLRPGLFGRTVERILPRSIRIRPSIVCFLVILLCAVVFTGVQSVLYSTDDQRPLSAFSLALKNVPAGSRILNPDWHFFMPAVALRPDLKYAGGMDPSFTYVDNPAAAKQLAYLITPAFQSDDTIIDARGWLSDMLAIYPSDYLILFAARHTVFIRALDESGMKSISGSPQIALYRLQ